MNFQPLENYVKEYVCGDRNIPGCNLRVAKDHEILFSQTYGYNEVETKKPLLPNARYFLFSCTKPVTVTAAMRLVEEGKLDLDRPVSDYLPAYKNVKAEVDGKLVPAVPLVRHLFTMSSGLDYDCRKDTIKAYIDAHPHASTQEVCAVFAETPLHFMPGTRYKYSLSHDVLAAVIEVVSGMTFGEYLKKTIFDPLGMERTGFRDTEDIHKEIVEIYETHEDGSLLHGDCTNSYFAMTDRYESGGAGLISTADDYIRFTSAMAAGGVTRDGYRILSEASIRLMRTPALLPEARASFECPCGPDYTYGLGVRTRVFSLGKGTSPVGEFGWDGAAGSYLFIDAENNLSMFVGMSVTNWISRKIQFVHANLRDLTYRALDL